MTRTRFGSIDQIGYLVDDLAQSIERRIDRLGVGPWTVFRNVPPRKRTNVHTNKRARTNAHMRGATFF